MLGDQALAGLEGLFGVDAPMDLGPHPMDLIANTFALDHHTHIRVDVLALGGPEDRPAPPVTEDHLDAPAEWILAGIPQMSRATAAQSVDLVLTGPARRTARIGPDRDAVSTVTSSFADLVLWATHRQSWRDLDVTILGDDAAATRFLDAVHVY